MRTYLLRRFLVLAALVSIPAAASGQRISGLVYSDYSYLVQDETGESDGENGFGLRRMYITGDFGISDDFSVRARVEANDGSTTEQGRIAPFVKDLYLKWSDFVADGHVLQIGITSPPSFTVSESFWGFRSLEKTIQDLESVVSSRDTGVALRGPITSSGSVRYGLMVGNDSGGRPESNKNKRVYGQLEFRPARRVAVTVGADYADRSGGEEGALNVNAFVGYRTDAAVVGVEVFSNQLDRVGAADRDHVGVSLFARAAVAPNVELVGRFDRTMTDVGASSTWSNYGVFGVSLSPHEDVHFIPNVLVSQSEADDQAAVTGRVTLHMDF